MTEAIRRWNEAVAEYIEAYGEYVSEDKESSRKYRIEGDVVFYDDNDMFISGYSAFWEDDHSVECLAATPYEAFSDLLSTN